MIGIIDYGMGNLRSVLNAFRFVGKDAVIVDNPSKLEEASAIVLPGVGAFGDAMKNLSSSDFPEALNKEIHEKGKQLLGICLGMQILATASHEHGEHQGLNWIKGTVERIPVPKGDATIRVPHVGWNEVKFKSSSPLLTGLDDARDFYFVHSYRFLPHDTSTVIGVCHHGEEIVAILAKDNIHAAQFHPEKSHNAGLHLIHNWCEQIVGC